MATRRRICRIQVLAKNSPFLANLSTRQNGLFRKCVGLARLADILQAMLHGLSDSPRFAEGHFWEKCDSPRQICASNSRFSRIWCKWPLLRTHALRRGPEFSLTISEEGFPWVWRLRPLGHPDLYTKLILNNIWTSFIKYFQFNASLKLYSFYELLIQESHQIWMPFLHSITHLTKFFDNKNSLLLWDFFYF